MMLGVAERLALVLAGGGIAGIAWETGFLLGVQEAQRAAAERLLDAEVLLGTSAGSTVAAQISSGAPLAELYARQMSQNTHELAPRIDVEDLLGLFEAAAGDTRTSLTDTLRAIGRRAVSAPTVTEEVRRSVIARRLPSHRWPDRRLEVTAIDVETGERVLFDRDSGVPLVDAVAASCAVPEMSRPWTAAWYDPRRSPWSSSATPQAGCAKATGGRVTLVAKNVKFDVDCISMAAPGTLQITMRSEDQAAHNVHVRGNGVDAKTTLMPGPVTQHLTRHPSLVTSR